MFGAERSTFAGLQYKSKGADLAIRPSLCYEQLLLSFVCFVKPLR